MTLRANFLLRKLFPMVYSFTPLMWGPNLPISSINCHGSKFDIDMNYIHFLWNKKRKMSSFNLLFFFLLLIIERSVVGINFKWFGLKRWALLTMDLEIFESHPHWPGLVIAFNFVNKKRIPIPCYFHTMNLFETRHIRDLLQLTIYKKEHRLFELT